MPVARARVDEEEARDDAPGMDKTSTFPLLLVNADENLDVFALILVELDQIDASAAVAGPLTLKLASRTFAPVHHGEFHLEEEEDKNEDDVVGATAAAAAAEIDDKVPTIVTEM